MQKENENDETEIADLKKTVASEKEECENETASLKEAVKLREELATALQEIKVTTKALETELESKRGAREVEIGAAKAKSGEAEAELEKVRDVN